MRTTLTLEHDVAARLNRLRKESGAKLKDLVNEALRRGLDANPQKRSKRPAYRVRPVAAKCLVPNLDCIASVLDSVDGSKWR